jgi:hypothetical protein
MRAMAIWHNVRGQQSFLVLIISIHILLISLKTYALVSLHESKRRPFAGVLSSHQQKGNAEYSLVTASGSSRRIVLNFIGKSILIPSSALIAGSLEPFSVSEAVAEENVVVVSSTSRITEMKDFLDPVGLFRVRVPKSFFVLRRSSKGDLPDPQTGQGRRGSSIFSAGDMTKAEIVAIERFPVKALLEEEGIDSSGDLSTFTSIGKPEAVANLITRRRDRDNKRGQQQTQTEILPSVTVSPDDKTLMFTLRTTIEVMKPDLLLEQTGASQLVRVTLAKATLQSNDGQLMVIFASALQRDFDGPDGDALKEVVSSFTVLDQSVRQSTTK